MGRRQLECGLLLFVGLCLTRASRVTAPRQMSEPTAIETNRGALKSRSVDTLPVTLLLGATAAGAVLGTASQADTILCQGGLTPEAEGVRRFSDNRCLEALAARITWVRASGAVQQYDSPRCVIMTTLTPGVPVLDRGGGYGSLEAYSCLTGSRGS